MGSITFNNAGTYNYDCSIGIHAAMGMTGQVTVVPIAGFYPPLGSTFNSDSSVVTLFLVLYKIVTIMSPSPFMQLKKFLFQILLH